jgi:hypothetical protein
MDAEAETDDVQIRNDRAERSDDPDSLWSAGPIETGSDPEGCYCVREDRGHFDIIRCCFRDILHSRAAHVLGVPRRTSSTDFH